MPNFGFLTKLWIFYQSLDFWAKFGFLSKLWIFEQNFAFWPKLWVLTKISIIDQNFEYLNFLFFCQISKFRFFDYFPNFHKILESLERLCPENPDKSKQRISELNPTLLFKENSSSIFICSKSSKRLFNLLTFPLINIIRNQNQFIFEIDSETIRFTVSESDSELFISLLNFYIRPSERRRFFRNVRAFVQNLAPKLLFWTASFISFKSLGL